MSERAIHAGLRRDKPVGALLSAAVVFGFLVILLSAIDADALPRYYFIIQDRWIAGYFAFVLAGLAFAKGAFHSEMSEPGWKVVAASSLVIVAIAYIGSSWVMLDYALTRDELMAQFDAEIFAAGKIGAEIDLGWRDYVLAMAPHFRLPVPDNAAWMSAYLPMHSVLRAGFGILFDPKLLNPVLAGIGLIALWDVSKRLFPRAVVAQWIVLGGYLLSAQILLTAMTSYAMTAHLASSCLWLSLFLRDTRWSHAGAIAVGIVAIGLHQIAFHPLFAGPFILTLFARRRWQLFVAYALAYGAAVLGFAGYHSWVVGEYAVASAATGLQPANAGMDFIENQVLPLLGFPSFSSFLFTEWNLLRFMAFMPAFLLPLLIMSGRALKEGRGVTVPLAGGIGLTLALLIVVIPYQGHGWGFRYLHGLIPSTLLLCAYGFEELRNREGDEIRLPIFGLALATIPAIVFLAISSNSFVAPFASLTQRIEKQPVDFVLIDTTGGNFSVDQVRNDPFLRNRPLIFDATRLDRARIETLCERGTVTLFGPSTIGLPEITNGDADHRRMAWLADWLSQLECYRRPTGARPA